MLVVGTLVSACGGGAARTATAPATSSSRTAISDSTSAATTTATTTTTTTSSTTKASLPRVRRLVVDPPGSPGPRWRAVARVRGHAAVWIAQRAGVTLLRFDQRRVRLVLHAGSADGGVVGWRYGDRITAAEIHLVIAAVNGGFKLSYTDVGFRSGGRTAVALKQGLASIVNYADGRTDIGAWRSGVPSGRSTVYSVLQNQYLLVNHGVAAANLASCVLACWGYTIQSLDSVARSSLGITRNGSLVWAAGEQLTPTQLAAANIAAGVRRAIELDINPAWVAGYLYLHMTGGPVADPVVPGQRGIAGQLLSPYSRDFLTFIAR